MAKQPIIDGNLSSTITEFFEEYYDDEIQKMDEVKNDSLTIDFEDLLEFSEGLAEDLGNNPDFWFKNADSALKEYDDDIELKSPRILLENYEQYKPAIRELRDKHLGRLVSIDGIVSKSTSVLPKAEVAAFNCQRCGTITSVKQPLDAKLKYPDVCSNEECNNRSESAFRINVSQSKKINFKKIEIQEPPEDITGGKTPESETFTVKGEIANNVAAGDSVKAIGIYKGAEQGDTSIFRTYLHGNNIIPEDQEFEEINITPEEIEQIIELSEDPEIYEKLRESIAPSLFGLISEKTSILYQLFGGVRKTEMTGNTIRGDVHVLMVGDPGVGKTISGDSRLLMGDGSLVDIKDFVNNNMTNPTKDKDGDYVKEIEDDIKVMAMDRDGEIEPRNVEAVWKKQVENCYKVTLADGRTIKTSDTHPLFTTDGNAHIKQVKVKDIDEGQFISVPCSISYDGNLELETEKISHKNGRKEIIIPDEWSEELAAFIGLIVGEGHITQEGTISVTNQDKELLNIAKEGFELFGLEDYREIYKEDNDTYIIENSSKNLIEFFNNLDSEFVNKSADKRIPDCIYSTPESIRKAFIRAYVDGEVHISEKQRELEIPSISEDSLRDLQQLLDTFGISSRLRDRTQDLSYNDVTDYESYRLMIYGDAFRKYVEDIGFYSNREIERAELMKDSCGSNSNVDVIPEVGSVVKETRELLGMHQFDFSIPRTTVLGIENEGNNPSKKTLQTMVVDMVDRLHVVKDVDYSRESADMETVEKMRKVLGMTQGAIATDGAGITKGGYRYHLTTNTDEVTERSLELFDYVSECLDERYHEAHENLIRLESLAWGDVRWEKVESVEKVEYDEEWMYDLQVEGTHNYVANGIMSHNSQLLRYASKLSPRGIMTNGKGSSAAGLCVGPDTYINYNGNLMKISDVVNPHIEDSVESPTAKQIDSYSRAYNLETGKVNDADTTHLWRMPEQKAKRIKTTTGRELVVSEQTPLLLSTGNGLEWVEASDISEGDDVSVQDDMFSVEFVDNVDLRQFIDFEDEIINLKECKRNEIKKELKKEFGTLRVAAEELGFSESFVYGGLKNRAIPYKKLEKIERDTAFKFKISDIEDVALRHGKEFTLPSELDEDFMWLFGMIIGDGNINKSIENRGVVKVSNSSRYVLERVQSIIKDKFGKEESIEIGHGDRPDYIRLSSKTVRKMFENLGMDTAPKTDICLDDEIANHRYVNHLIQGYMDADGSVYDRTEYKSGSSVISCSSVSESWIKQLQQILESKYGIHSNYRVRDSEGDVNVLSNGKTIRTNNNKHVLELRGKNIVKFVDKVGFSIDKKLALSEHVASISKPNSKLIPVGDVLKNGDSSNSKYYNNTTMGNNPRLETLNNLVQEVTLDSRTEQVIEQHTESSLKWESVQSIETIETELYDLTTEYSSFIANGIVTHNTASAVRDSEFGGDDKWTLKAGALVLADNGLACVDELDKMDASDRSAMHEGLEQQTISVNKAGINATLKSRCSMLGGANPKDGRWDEYQPVPEQIDLEPALVSRFDLIFAPKDDREEDEDRKLANHILTSNVRGQKLQAGKSPSKSSNEVEPDIEPDLFRKYIAYAKNNCHPVLTEDAFKLIEDFFVDIRQEGKEEGAIPVTARKIEGIVRLTEAAAKIQLSDEATEDHAKRAINIVRDSLKDVGFDEEAGRYDVDMTANNQNTTQRDRKKLLLDVIKEFEDEGEKGAPKDIIMDIMTEKMYDYDESQIEHDLDKFSREGQELLQPVRNEYRVM